MGMCFMSPGSLFWSTRLRERCVWLTFDKDVVGTELGDGGLFQLQAVRAGEVADYPAFGRLRDIVHGSDAAIGMATVVRGGGGGIRHSVMLSSSSFRSGFNTSE